MAVYKTATMTLVKDLESKMKKNKDIKIEREELEKKLDMLRHKIQEREERKT